MEEAKGGGGEGWRGVTDHKLRTNTHELHTGHHDEKIMMIGHDDDKVMMIRMIILDDDKNDQTNADHTKDSDSDHMIIIIIR